MSWELGVGFIVGFFGVELASYFLHRHLFHGALWFIHQSHHRARRGAFEWNDVFSFGFAGLAVFLMVTRPEPDFWFAVGAGISTYGTLYFIAHDLYTHGRWMRFESRFPGLNRIRQAHRKHHQSASQPGQEPYGLFWYRESDLQEKSR